MLLLFGEDALIIHALFLNGRDGATYPLSLFLFGVGCRCGCESGMGVPVPARYRRWEQPKKRAWRPETSLQDRWRVS